MRFRLCLSLLLLFQAWVDITFGTAESQSVNERVKELLQGMTLDEKIAQTFAGHGHDKKYLPTLKKTGMGAIKLSLSKDGGFDTPIDMIRARNELQRYAVNSSSGIPVSFYDEADHGATRMGTIFPELIGQGCSWNTTLVHLIHASIAREGAAVGLDTLFSPVVNMVVDPRFGRMQENFSENPILTARMAVASVLGLQNSSKKVTGNVAAIAKHFAAYGDASGGMNGGASVATERMLFDVYLRPWKAMAAVGLKGLMPAHNTILHIPCHANSWLLNTTMRNNFQFKGIMISDCNDIPGIQDFRIAANISHSAALAIKAGVDLDLQCKEDMNDWAYYHLKQAMDEGLVTEEDIDRTVTRILSHKVEMGLFDDRAFIDEKKSLQILDNARHRKLAREAAEQSIVLLINRNKTLPISVTGENSVKSIALIGPTASKLGCNCSEAVSSLAGSYSHLGAHVVTLDEALQKELPNVKVDWARGCTASGPTGTGINKTEIAEAVSLAESSDISILILGDVQGSGCGEWEDRDSLDLQGGQLALLKAVASTARRTIVILIHGRPQTFGDDNNGVLSKIDAMFAAWRPGEEFGNAMLRLLTGSVSPSAKLSQSWPRSVGHVGSGSVPWLQEVKGKWVYNERGPADEDGRRYNEYASSTISNTTPLFYFGYGLSYTVFKYESMSVRTVEGSMSNPIMWTIDVVISNQGDIDAAEVIQVYVKDPILPYVPFWKRLVGFSKCFVTAYSTSTCHVTVLKEDLECFDPDSIKRMRIFGGKYRVSVGGSSNSDSLHKDVVVKEGNRDSFVPYDVNSF